MTEDGMVGCHHQLYEHEFEQDLGFGDGNKDLCVTVHGVTKSETRVSNWTKLDKSKRGLMCALQMELRILEKGKLSCIIGMSLKWENGSEWENVISQEKAKRKAVLTRAEEKRSDKRSSGKSYMGLHIKEFGYLL